MPVEPHRILESHCSSSADQHDTAPLREHSSRFQQKNLWPLTHFLDESNKNNKNSEKYSKKKKKKIENIDELLFPDSRAPSSHNFCNKVWKQCSSLSSSNAASYCASCTCVTVRWQGPFLQG